LVDGSNDIYATHWVHTYQNFRACGGLNGALRALGNLNTPPDTITPVTSPGDTVQGFSA